MKTKHDISAENVTLNFEELLSVANMAMATSKIQIERALGNIYNSYGKMNTGVCSDAENLERFATSFRKAAHLVHALEAAKERENLTIKKDS